MSYFALEKLSLNKLVSIWVLNFMLLYLISRKITDPSSLEEIIFHTMSSFSDYCSNELQQGKCFSREQNRALERKLVIFLLSISENISFKLYFKMKPKFLFNQWHCSFDEIHVRISSSAAMQFYKITKTFIF